MPSKNTILITVSVSLLILFFFADIFIGSVNISLTEVFGYLFNGNISPENKIILSEFRLPKAITAIIAGSALSVAGLQMQTVFRNPLAGPFILGISSGASFGVAVLILGFASFTGGLFFSGTWAIVAAAWTGAGAVLFLIFIFSMRIRNVMTVLILGVLLGSAVSSLVSIMQYFGNASQVKTFVIWTMGSLSGVTKEQLYIIIPSVAVGLVLSLLSIKILNVLLLGETYAKTVGLNLLTSRLFIFTSTSLLAGTVTAFCGPIGFVGIIAPHIARITFKTTNHAILIPASATIGAVMILLSDIISQMPGTYGTLPINSITAVLGIPVIIKIIFSKMSI